MTITALVLTLNVGDTFDVGRRRYILQSNEPGAGVMVERDDGARIFVDDNIREPTAIGRDGRAHVGRTDKWTTAQVPLRILAEADVPITRRARRVAAHG